MKVKELIKLLNKYSEDLEVQIGYTFFTDHSRTVVSNNIRHANLTIVEPMQKDWRGDNRVIENDEMPTSDTVQVLRLS